MRNFAFKNPGTPRNGHEGGGGGGGGESCWAQRRLRSPGASAESSSFWWRSLNIWTTTTSQVGAYEGRARQPSHPFSVRCIPPPLLYSSHISINFLSNTPQITSEASSSSCDFSPSGDAQMRRDEAMKPSLDGFSCFGCLGSLGP